MLTQLASLAEPKNFEHLLAGKENGLYSLHRILSNERSPADTGT
jgi:hypothetical protein